MNTLEASAISEGLTLLSAVIAHFDENVKSETGTVIADLLNSVIAVGQTLVSKL